MIQRPQGFLDDCSSQKSNSAQRMEMSPHVGEWRQGAEIMELGKANSNSRNLYLVQIKEEGTLVGQRPGLAFLVTLSSLTSPRHLICSIYKTGV